MILNSDALEEINNRTFDKVLAMADILAKHVIERMQEAGVEKEAAESLAKFSIGTTLLEIGTIMNRKLGTEKADVLKIIEEAWEDAEGDPPARKLSLVKG